MPIKENPMQNIPGEATAGVTTSVEDIKAMIPERSISIEDLTEIALNVDSQIESEAEARVIAKDFAERHNLDVAAAQDRAGNWFDVGNRNENFHPGLTVEVLLTRLSTEYLLEASESLIELGIAVYRVGEVYPDNSEIPASDKRKWFVSAPKGSPFAGTVEQIPLADTEREAWKLAAQHYLPKD